MRKKKEESRKRGKQPEDRKRDKGETKGRKTL